MRLPERRTDETGLDDGVGGQAGVENAQRLRKSKHRQQGGM
jgi:hypothetical protein